MKETWAEAVRKVKENENGNGNENENGHEHGNDSRIRRCVPKLGSAGKT